MSIELDFEGLDELEVEWSAAVSKIGAGTEDAVRSAAKSGQSAARIAAPFKTGDLRSKIDGIVTESDSMSAEGAVISGSDHAAIINDGSKAHPIEARRAKALRFVSNGQTVFTRRVNHPGTKPNPYMDKAEAAVDAKLPKAMDAIVEDAINGMR